MRFFIQFPFQAVNYALERSEDASLRALAASSSSRLEELRRGAAAYAEECRRRGRLLRSLAPGGEKHFDERGDPVPPFLGARLRCVDSNLLLEPLFAR